jgi:hypothetical protein
MLVPVLKFARKIPMTSAFSTGFFCAHPVAVSNRIAIAASRNMKGSIPQIRMFLR